MWQVFGCMGDLNLSVHDLAASIMDVAANLLAILVTLPLRDWKQANHVHFIVLARTTFEVKKN